MSDHLQPMDCSPPGPSVHGISQASIRGMVAISFTMGPFQPRNGTRVASRGVCCLTGRYLTSEPAGRPDGNFTLMVYTHANYTLIFIKIFQTVEEEGYSLVYSIKLELHLPIKTLQEKKVKPQMPYKYARKNLLRY